VNIAVIAVRNLARNRTRAALTVLAGGVAVLAFILLRTVNSAWQVRIDSAAKDRISTRSKVSFSVPLPERYADEIRAVPGVKAATKANWFGGKAASHPEKFFASIAVEPRRFLEVFDDISLTEREKAAWFEDRQGAIVGDLLAKQLGVHVGSPLTLTGTVYPGDWSFRVAGIYATTRRSVDRSMLLFHWSYLNESLDESRKNEIGWVVARIDDLTQSANICTAVDRLFDERDIQTTTMSERAESASFLGALAAAFSLLDVISAGMLVILALILGNTIGMSVRERAREYAVLRAIGFRPARLAISVVVEGIATGLFSGAMGLLLAYPIVNMGIGRWIEDNMASLFRQFQIQSTTVITAMILAVGFSVAASAWPAYRVMKLPVTWALRGME
jgi:putative ABC transport system permease protein